MHRHVFAACAAAAALCAFQADAKAISKEGFAFPAGHPVKIMVFRPNVQVGSLSAGGVDEPNADWTQKARDNMAAALGRNPAAHANSFVFLPDLTGEAGARVADYNALFHAVSEAILAHKMLPGNRLPTKKDRFDWTLGAEAARLREIGGADYALFFFSHDAYGSAGRKTAQVFAAMLGAYVPAGVHAGYAGLVDLRTGDVVWFNTDFQMGGDVRESLGADKRVTELLRGFPGTDEAQEVATK